MNFRWSGHDAVVSQLVEVLRTNKTLMYLLLPAFTIPGDIDVLRTIVSALHENTTLQRLGLHVQGEGSDDVSVYMKTHYKDITDDRITWNKPEDHPPSNGNATSNI